MPSWEAEPQRLHGRWTAYRQVAPDWAPLYHAAGEPQPSQQAGRWHRMGEGYAQYLSLDAAGAWAELIRYEAIRGGARAAEYRRQLWVFSVDDHDIANLSTFDTYHACGLDPQLAIGDHAAAQALAGELRAAGYRGVLSPSAALAGAVNLTLFGVRYERPLTVGIERWDNPDPDVWLPGTLIAECPPPSRLIPEATFIDEPHLGIERWLGERA